MNRVMMTTFTCVCGLLLALGTHASYAIDHAADEALIRTAVNTYVAAFNRGDAKALAGLWSPEAVYTNPVSGEQVIGREAIEKQFVDIFVGSPGAQLEAQTTAIQFVSPNVAIEQGTAKVADSDKSATESEYTAVYVKRDGQWLLDRVTEEDAPVVLSNYDQLKELEWMIGSWLDQDEQSKIETKCQWTKNKNFMIRYFALEVRERIEMAGMQIVGWDPSKKQIRSWVFDSDGGFGEGQWTKKGNAWHIQSVGKLPDGESSSSVGIITYVDNDTFTWQSVNREAGGQILPNVDEVIVVRQPDSE